MRSLNQIINSLSVPRNTAIGWCGVDAGEESGLKAPPISYVP